MLACFLSFGTGFYLELGDQLLVGRNTPLLLLSYWLDAGEGWGLQRRLEMYGSVLRRYRLLWRGFGDSVVRVITWFRWQSRVENGWEYLPTEN